MIIKLLKLSFVITLLLISVIFLVKGMTPPSSLNPFTLLFMDADGKPCAPQCMFGIYPNVTPKDSVVGIFTQHPLTKAFIPHVEPSSVSLVENGYVPYAVFWNVNSSFVTEVTWSKTLTTPLYSVADILAVLGIPDCVGVIDDSFSFTYLSTNIYILGKTVHQGQLTPQDSVEDVTIYGDRLHCDKDSTVPWRGFVSQFPSPVPVTEIIP